MAYKNKEKERAVRRAYYAKHKDDPEWMAKRRRYNNAYNATHKHVRAAYRDTHKEERAAYYDRNSEKLKRQHKEYYQKNKEATIQRTTRYHHEHKEWRKKYYKGYYGEIRLEVLARIDPAMKCARCGCDDTKFLEINHIKGGGNKEHKKRGKKVTRNMILLIHHKKRSVEDLNLLCRICNALDHLERVFGKTRIRIVWDKPVTNTPVPALDQNILISRKSENS